MRMSETEINKNLNEQDRRKKKLKSMWDRERERNEKVEERKKIMLKDTLKSGNLHVKF